MKIQFNTKEAYEKKHKRKHEECYRLSKWHEWFAWYPVKVSSWEYRWLEVVYRYGEYNPCSDEPYIYIWNYKAK